MVVKTARLIGLLVVSALHPRVARNFIRILAVLGFGLMVGGDEGQAGPVLYSTSNVAKWQVATRVGGIDGSFSSFPTSGFVPATTVAGRASQGVNWIANNSTGSNGNLTFFVFRQTFDLTGYDPLAVSLAFQWAADDSGQGILSRGSWIPKYRLNGGSLVAGSWPNGESYDFGPTTVISRGFLPGLNTLDFFVQGNGGTDGMALRPVPTTSAVPEPATIVGLALGTFGLIARATQNRRNQVEQ